MGTWAEFVLRHRRWVVAFWLCVLVAGGIAAGRTSDRLTVDFSLPGQPGTEAADKIVAAVHNGGNTTPHVLSVQYQIASPGTITGANTPSAGWTPVAALNFTGPVATATAGPLDGNAPANRVAISATLSVSVAAPVELMRGFPVAASHWMSRTWLIS